MNRSVRMMIAQSYIEQGYPTIKVLGYLNIPRSSFYYKPVLNPKRKGRNKSTSTRTTDGRFIRNEIVIHQIEQLLSMEFVDYGYLKVTHYLRQTYDYIINDKKVYRLMKENRLLNRKRHISRGQRKWVTELVPNPLRAFEYLELDIKYVYIQGSRKNALLLSVIDVYSRWCLGHYMSWSMKGKEVELLFDQIFDNYNLPSKIYVRNDNGSQFTAHHVQSYFSNKGVEQEFIKPATPEQNAHIESYHSILERVVCQRYEFENINECQLTLNRFIRFYNWERIHSGIQYMSPSKFLRIDQKMKIDMNNVQMSLDCRINTITHKSYTPINLLA